MKRNDGGKNVYKTACACNANASFDRSLSKTHYLIQYISAQRLLRKTWSAGGSSSCQISSFTRPDAVAERTMRVLVPTVTSDTPPFAHPHFPVPLPAYSVHAGVYAHATKHNHKPQATNSIS